MNLNDVANFIIDKPGETFQVNRRLFTDPQLFQLEMKYIYEKVWIYMAHESEIPNAYDYMTACIHRGDQPRPPCMHPPWGSTQPPCLHPPRRYAMPYQSRQYKKIHV